MTDSSAEPTQKKSWSHWRIIVKLDQAEPGRWLAEIQEAPELTAYGQTPEEAIRQLQVFVLRWIADRIESGDSEPTEFTITIGSPSQTVQQAYVEAIQRLDAATSLFLRSDLADRRNGSWLAIVGTIKFLSDLGFHRRLLIPLERLAAALEGLKDGRRDPLIVPPKNSANKPPEPTAAWNSRAALAAALQVRVTFMKERLNDAADTVVKDAGTMNVRIAGPERAGAQGEARPENRVKQLRKNFNAGNNRVPRDGQPRNIYDLTNEHAAEAAKCSDPLQRRQWLEQIYKEAMLEAVIWQDY